MNGPDDHGRPGSFSADDWEPAANPQPGGRAPDAPNSVPGSFGAEQQGAAEEPTSRSLRFSVPSAAELLLGIPWAIWSLGVVSSVSSWIFDGFADTLVVTLWVLSGLLILLPATEDAVARFLCRLRKPTLMEQQKLDIAWRAVCAHAGVDPGFYKLWVEESDSVNGISVAGRSVAVTRWALNNLPPRQLQAVLAHELGHHRGGHPWATLLVFWYAQPARWTMAAIQAMARLRTAIGCLITIFFVLALAGLVLRSMMWGGWGWAVYAVLPFLVPIPLAWFSRRSEFIADRVAADLGYARDTIRFFYDVQSQGEDVARRAAGWRGAVYATHPTIADRIRSLETYVQATG
ncbi:M48 family metalloprotease [Kribbella sp.]|uniref:M48 family metalloprotease n=1 Tax=Kribbella sp. TaxID=1871183 RepID=UPI002D34B053|nr:M48 family metalloprotease [Kribbella sp.]HZX07288.1 M48 family metalloprotease [Kribbella sp.]